MKMERIRTHSRIRNIIFQNIHSLRNTYSPERRENLNSVEKYF